jgi:hypothetical protein
MNSLLQNAARWYFRRLIPARLAVGDLCSVESGDKFGIVKVLLVERDLVHVRSYREKFRERPTVIDSARLSLGSINDPGGFGIGHFPLSLSTFGSWKPARIKNEPVSDDELMVSVYGRNTGAESGAKKRDVEESL